MTTNYVGFFYLYSVCVHHYSFVSIEISISEKKPRENLIVTAFLFLQGRDEYSTTIIARSRRPLTNIFLYYYSL